MCLLMCLFVCFMVTHNQSLGQVCLGLAFMTWMHKLWTLIGCYWPFLSIVLCDVTGQKAATLRQGLSQVEAWEACTSERREGEGERGLLHPCSTHVPLPASTLWQIRSYMGRKAAEMCWFLNYHWLFALAPVQVCTSLLLLCQSAKSSRG